MPSEFNQYKNNIMLETIKGAGLFLFYNDGEKNKYLILLNSQTNIWEPTKGVKDVSESFLACALRECKEETSINIKLKISSIYSPFTINYRVSNNIQKSIKIFPAKIRDQRTVILSHEHKSFKWIDWEEAERWNTSNTLKSCYFNIISKIESISKREIVNYREILTKSLKDVVVNNHKTCNYDWILTGSISANEYTVYEKEILSDIDLVAIGDIIPEPNAINQINETIQSYLSQEKEFHKLSVGIMFINRYKVIDSHTPFGSYLERFSSLINSSSNQLHFLMNGSDDNSYNLFRLYWYTSLRSIFFDEIEYNYHYLKANLLLFYFKNRKMFSHFSYSAIKNQIIVELSKHTSSEIETSLLMLLKAADTKLNHANFLLNRNWEKFFFNEFEILKSKINNDQYVIMNEISKIINNKIEVSSALIELFKLHFNNNDIIDLYNNACSRSDKKFIWVLLILLRIKIWPDQVKFSTKKYADNIKTLLKENVLIQNEIIKNKLSSLFVEFEWGNSNVLESEKYQHTQPSTFAIRTSQR